MKKISTLLIGLFLIVYHSYGQSEQANVIYIIDSIPVIDDPTPENDIVEKDIADITVVKNRDILKMLGYDNFDGAIYIFTKDYRSRPESLMRIPSTRQMENKSGVWHFKGSAYNGHFIDYYYSGRKEGEGIFKDGKVHGIRKTYYQNGNLSMERIYTNGIENGLEKEYYEDGSLRQKGEFVNGKEEGVWEKYFPNGNLKQRSFLKNGKMEGETSVFYSTGKILAVEITKNGKTAPDKRLEKINQAMSKGHSRSKEGDFKTAIKHYSKAIELDSTFAEAYFSRGTVKLNEFQFDEAILDFNKALQLEPYFEKALTNRAFARIRMQQFGNSRQISKSNGVTVLASKDNPGIPESDLALICTDLNQAIFLGDNGKMIMEAVLQFCGTKSSK